MVRFLVILSLFGLLLGQEDQSPKPADSDSPGFRIGVAVDQVFLSVNARSVAGGFVKDLTAEDFVVLEDNVRQEIVNFYSEQVPVHVVLLIDASGSTRYSQVDIRRAAYEFASRLSPEDRVSIITFNDASRLILNWTNELERVQKALETIYAKGPTVLNDAVYVTFDDLFRDVEGKKAVILLTDGIDTGSMVSFEESIDLAIRSEALIYIVSKLEEYWANAIAFRQELRAHAQIIPKELTDEFILDVRRSLKRLAETSGGKVLDAAAFASLTDIYAQVAEELKNQYYISYSPINKNKDGRWRSIDIQTRRGGVVATTRRGYFAAGRLGLGG